VLHLNTAESEVWSLYSQLLSGREALPRSGSVPGGYSSLRFPGRAAGFSWCVRVCPLACRAERDGVLAEFVAQFVGRAHRLLPAFVARYRIQMQLNVGSANSPPARPAAGSATPSAISPEELTHNWQQLGIDLGGVLSVRARVKVLKSAKRSLSCNAAGMQPVFAKPAADFLDQLCQC